MCSTVVRLAMLVGFCGLATLAFARASFPGAEGAGATTVGGKGGNIYFVDNLNPNGLGSFQYAVDAVNEPRIVIFRVSGIIDLLHDLTIDKPYLTIAGQTAPGDGICIRSYTVMIARTHDVIVRHVRFRPGDISGTCPTYTPQAWNGGGLYIDGAYNVVVDHCSMSWAPDECIHVYDGGTGYDCTNVTLQWNIISESLNNSVHTEGPHGCGLLIKTDGGTISAHHNLLVDHDARNPRLGSSPTGSSTYRQYLDWRNNVVYNWGNFSGHGAAPSEYCSMNFVGNWYKSGPDTVNNGSTLFRSGTTKSSYANRYQIYKNDTYANYLNDSSQSGTWNWFLDRYTQLTTALTFPSVTMYSATTAKTNVLSSAGASPRDSVDARAVSQVTNNNGNIINSQADVGGWPTYNSTAAPTDTDNDGMPDSFESTYGVSDIHADADSDGYENIEEYINGTNPNSAD